MSNGLLVILMIFGRWWEDVSPQEASAFNLHTEAKTLKLAASTLISGNSSEMVAALLSPFSAGIRSSTVIYLHVLQIMANKNVSRDKEVRSSLLTHVLQSDSLHLSMVLSISEGLQVNYHHAKATKYLKTLDESIKNMLVVVHIGSGMPATATELLTYRIVDGPSCKRNIFYMHNNICLHCEYSKTRSITCANRPILRFLDEGASALLLKEILIVRPFLSTLASFLELNDDNIYCTDYFVKKWSTNDCRESMKHLCQIVFSVQWLCHFI